MTRNEFTKACAAIVLMDLNDAERAEKWGDDLTAAIAPAVAAGEQMIGLGEEIKARFDAAFPPLRFELPPQILEHLK